MRTRITLFAASMLVSLLVASTNALALDPLDPGLGVVQSLTTTQTTLDAGTVARTQSQVEAIGKTVLGGTTTAPAPSTAVPSVSTAVPSVPQSPAPLAQARQALPAPQGTAGSQPSPAAQSPAGSTGGRQAQRTRSPAPSPRRNADAGRRERHSGAGGADRGRANAAGVSDRGPRDGTPGTAGSFGAHNSTAYRITDECCDATPRPPGEPSVGFDPAWGVGGGSAVGFGIGTLVVVLIAAVFLVGARTNARTERV
jgi:hypothetical protein